MLPAKTAEFIHFQPIRIILFVFDCVIITLFAFGAGKGYFYSHG